MILIQSAHLEGHHAHPLHAPATAYTSVGTLVSSGVALDFRVQYASAIEALVDDFSAQPYAAQVGLVTWPDRKGA